jgi:hypothetical protein
VEPNHSGDRTGCALVDDSAGNALAIDPELGGGVPRWLFCSCALTVGEADWVADWVRCRGIQGPFEIYCGRAHPWYKALQLPAATGISKENPIRSNLPA